MKFQTIRALRGPNLWSNSTVIDAVLLAPTVDLPSSLGSLLERAMRRIAECGNATSAPPRRYPLPMSWGGLVLAVTAEFQRVIGTSVEFQELHVLDGQRSRLLLSYREESVARRAIEFALELTLAVASGVDLDVASAVRELRTLDENARLGPSTQSLATAAEQRGIPVARLNEGSLLRLGQGSKQRRVWAAETDRTSAVGEAIAQDKELTKHLLDAVGIPVPQGRLASSAAEAWDIACDVGLPVAVKPRSGNQGKGVSVRLSSRDAVETAFDLAAVRDGQVLVERHIEGDDFRLLVIGGKLVAAARREPPRVVGDGVKTIAELVAIVNLDPRRGEDHATSLSKLRLDAIGLETLAEQGFVPASIPDPGQVVLLRQNANLSTGGSAEDVTDEVHPAVAERAVEAARMVGLDIAGIDLVATCVDKPLEESGGAFVEVNAVPGLRMHLDPSGGTPRAVGDAIVDSMFPPGSTGRIPVVAVTGTNGKTTTTRCITHILTRAGKRVGMTCTDGIFVDGKRLDDGDCSGPKSARLVLGHPLVDAAVLETARGGLLREGLGVDQCDVVVVTNIGEGDHLGMNGINTSGELARVKGIPVRRVAPHGYAVLNADDPFTLYLMGICPGKVILFSKSPQSELLLKHRAAGGRTATVRDGYLILADGETECGIAHVNELPLTHRGRVGFQVENLLASACAAYALGHSFELIRAALIAFAGDVTTVPGRFNVVEHRDATIILDYGHNADALIALNDAILQMPHKRRKVVYTAAGDRRDEDILRQAQLIGSFFDEIYVYEDQCTRGRSDGEILRLMGQGFLRSRKNRAVYQATGELAAIGAAIAELQPGDLLLCQIDRVELALEFVNELLQQRDRSPQGSVAQFANASAAALGLLSTRTEATATASSGVASIARPVQ